MTLDLAWHADHQDHEIVWRSASSVFPEPAPSARFLLGAAGAGEPLPVRDVGRTRRCCCTSWAARDSAGARALLLDSESVRLGLEDVAGYNPVHLKTYNRYLLASNGGTAVDRHFEYVVRAPTARAARARRALLRLAAGTAAARAAGRLPGPRHGHHARSRRRCRWRGSCGPDARRSLRASSGAIPTASTS